MSLLVHLSNQGLVYYDEGLRLAKSGQEEAALHHLQTAVVLNPEHTDSYVVMGKLYAQRGAYEEAISTWQRALHLAPPDSPARAKAEQGIAKAKKIQRHRLREAAAVRRRHRGLTAAAGVAVFILGVGFTFLFPKIWTARVTPAGLTQKWSQALDTYPALRQAALEAKVQDGGLVISGEVPSPVHRDLISSLSQTFLPHTLDVSRVKVRPVPEAAALERILADLPGQMKAMGPRQDLLWQALAGSRINVTAQDDNRLHLSGAVPSREIKHVVENIAVLMAGRERVDTSALQVGPEYLVYRVQVGDYPKGLARRFYGDSRRWEDIRRFSPENARVLQDPRRLQVGAILKIPKPLSMKEKP
jgi:nucleoid-associated protein YgaU